MGSSKRQTTGFRYGMGLHMGLNLECDALLELQAGERTAFTGPVTENQQITISEPNLFGGDDREGGLDGVCDVMMGREDQAPNAYLTEQQGALQPGYRGFLGLVYRGQVSANSPYIKNWSARVRSILRGWHGGEAWYPDKASVPVPTGREDILTEDFSNGLAGFTALGAGMQGVSIVNVGGKTAMRVAPPVEFNEIAGAQREFKMNNVSRLAGSFRVHEAGDGDDWSVLDFNSVSGPGIAIARNGFDNQISLGYGPTSYLFNLDEPIPVGEWWGFEMTHDADAGEGALRITRESDGAIIAEIVMPSSTPIEAIQNFSVRTESTSSGVVDWANITASGSIGGVGMNPAHILYQALTDPDWGMGYPAAMIEDDSFRAAADLFFNEGMGLCLKWVNQSSVREFTQVVADHASFNYGQNRRTGKFEILPLRQNYNVNDLPVFTAKNARLVSYQRPALTDTCNEIVVEFVDAITGKDSTIAPVQNLANIMAQGRVVSQKLSFPGLPTNQLAARVGMRELRSRSTPLWKMKLELQRGPATAMLSGEPFVVDFRDQPLGALVIMRAVEMNLGTAVDSVIVADCVEDVFGMPEATYIGDPGPSPPPPDTSPRVGPAAAFEVPYIELVQAMGAAELATLEDHVGFVGAAAVRPPGVPMNFDLYTRVGAEEYQVAATGNFAPSGTLAEAIPATDEPTSVELAGASGLASMTIGSAAFLGEGSGAEIVRIDAVDVETMTVLLGRGCADTVSSAWPAGTRLWAFDIEAAADTEKYAAGETVSAKVVNRAGSGIVPIDAAPTFEITLASRQARPYPPAGLAIGGESDPGLQSGEITVTWAHRHRVLQADQLASQDEASIGPEPGTTYTMRTFIDDVLVDTQSEIDAATASVLPGADGQVRIELEAVRDGLVSWHMQTRTFPYTVNPAPARITVGGAHRITVAGNRRRITG